MSRVGRVALLASLAALMGGPAVPAGLEPQSEKRPSKKRRRPALLPSFSGARIAVMTRQLKRATVRRQAMKLAEDRGLTRRQAKRNRARTKAETKRERREGGAL